MDRMGRRDQRLLYRDPVCFLVTTLWSISPLLPFFIISIYIISRLEDSVRPRCTLSTTSTRAVSAHRYYNSSCPPSNQRQSIWFNPTDPTISCPHARPATPTTITTTITDAATATVERENSLCRDPRLRQSRRLCLWTATTTTGTRLTLKPAMGRRGTCKPRMSFAGSQEIGCGMESARQSSWRL